MTFLSRTTALSRRHRDVAHGGNLKNSTYHVFQTQRISSSWKLVNRFIFRISSTWWPLKFSRPQYIDPSGTSRWSLSRFPYSVKRLHISICTPPWIGCQSIVGLPHSIKFTDTLYSPAWREVLWEWSDLPSAPARARTQTTWSGALTIRPLRLPATDD